MTSTIIPAPPAALLRIAFLVSIALAFIPVAVRAQQDTAPTYGRLTGRVIDAATGQGISGAFVQVVGQVAGPDSAIVSMTVQSGVGGRFAMPRVRTGPLSLQVRRLGYAPKQLTGLYLHEGEAIEQDVSMTVVELQLQTVTVDVRKERGSLNAALDAQRTAVGVTNSVTSEQVAKSPDGDAAQVVKRVSGATVQDGKYVFVRGLGERYTISSLNGARVPSPEPERRVVPLDMFPAGLLQSITTFKTFTPDLPGDFSGALVDIRTREFPAHRAGMLQVGSGVASGATGARVLTATSTGGESFAMVNHQRDLPQDVRSLGNFQGVNITQGDINRLVRSFRDSWTPQPGTGSPLMNGSGSIGGNDAVLGHRVGYLVSASISSGTDVKEGQVRALADRGSTPGSTVEMDRFTGQTTSRGVLWGGLANLSTLVGNGSRFSFNGMYNRSADNDSRVERGEFTSDALPVKITRMQYVERSVHSAQFAGEHQITDAQRLDWAVTLSGVRRFEPDRSAFVQVIDHDTPGGPEVLRWLSGGSGGAVRTFSNLAETSREASAKYQLRLSSGASPVTLKLGALYRSTARDAESVSYAISANGASNDVRELTPEQIFDGRFSTASSNLFTLGPLSQGGSYTARDHLRAGFAMLDAPLGRSLRVVGGARYESDHLDVDATSTLGSPVSTRKRWNDFLPALALNWQLTGSQQVRISGSRTLARPEYRELSPITSRDVINGENLRGDENLERTNVTNADIRWEMYPHPSEALSVAFFAKQFRNPIERVYGSGSGGTSFVFYTNAERADNYGMEVDVRKNLGFLMDALGPFNLFGNVTVMQSVIHLYRNTQASATNLSRRMVGQAPYVINAGIAYASDAGRATATLLFNRVGPRISAAGGTPLPDVIEQPRNVLDLSVRLDITGALTVRTDLKNLIDSPYSVIQGTVTREFYRAGRTIQAGFLWHP